ncbi:MAG TPA: histidinol-phosphate transaminase [Candidatus Intestinimonas pullistercoris]|uniref:Histidinol-phosphate aminotransferase n=1 Tax=Candidatus Intestinimonas pullistercoris TaxID=2838623 RepID=A0A9D2P0S2_9FIRM|nr:histidinol-phosphate transaminase [uncultured Intestinimonas sp.]HJC40775.1 histidinol-phosphate transaminase [Candidatus Intestinimonas pullistercoris]
MKKHWSQRIRDMIPYVPGEQPRDRQFIKLNTNENPYPPSPKALEALRAAAGDSLRLYPDPECTELRAAIAAAHGLSPEQVFPGNGSDEVLAFCFQAFFDPDRPVRFADITYTFYAVYASYFGLTPELVPLAEDFTLPVADLLAPGCGGVVLANPNAPTGLAVKLADIRRILEAHRDQVVLVDEAYIDFGGASADVLVPEYDNLVVVRTLSKGHALAGLRVGYALAQPDLIAALRCVRDSINSYTVDRAAQAAAAASLRDAAYFQERTAQVVRTRQRTALALRDMGFAVTDSQANFLFVRHPQVPAKTLLDGLRERGILVRWFDRPRIRDYLRITVGTDGEMDALTAALKELTEV